MLAFAVPFAVTLLLTGIGPGGLQTGAEEGE